MLIEKLKNILSTRFGIDMEKTFQRPFLSKSEDSVQPVDARDHVDKDRPRLNLKLVKFRDGSAISLNETKLVVIVGPNNVGKSATLREIRNLLKEKQSSSNVVDSLDFTYNGTQKQLEAWVAKNLKTNEIGRYVYMGRSLSILNYAWKWERIFSDGLGDLAELSVTFLPTKSRLEEADSVESINAFQESPQHPIHLLHLRPDYELYFSEVFKKMFGVDVLVNRSAGKRSQLHIGYREKLEHNPLFFSYESQMEIQKLPLLQDQGDGMRSLASVLLSSFFRDSELMLIDEPEAFLHPPQAFALGTVLAERSNIESKTFIATHSSDLVRGLLDAGNKYTKVLRLTRDGDNNFVHLIDSDKLSMLWSDPLLKHSNILDAVFHEGAVICEGDADCRFFQALYSVISDTDKRRRARDIMFLHCGGKDRMHIAARALFEVGVDLRLILDIDVISSKTTIRNCFEAVGGDWNTIEEQWRIVKDSIESKRTDLSVTQVRNSIDRILDASADVNLNDSQIIEITKIMKRASPWSVLKLTGSVYIPSGEPTNAFRQLYARLQEKGVVLIEHGELESFDKSIAKHGPQWANIVLTKDLANAPELSLAREFVRANIIEWGH